jgi:hypothetical protein
MLARDLTTLIVADGNGTEGTDLFIGDLPAAPDACAAVIEYPGTNAVRFFSTLSVNENPRAQVKVRGVAFDYANPRNRIERIYQALMNRGSVVVNNTRYLDLEPLQPPFALEQDKNSRWVFAMNLAAMKERSTTT